MRRPGPPGRAGRIVTFALLPLAALKWIAVGLAVLVMLVVAPLVELAVGSLARLRRLFAGPSGRDRQ